MKLGEQINRIKNFFRETRSELKKVVWPDRRYVMVATVIIIVLVVITGLYVTLVDLILGKIFGLIIK